jgi:hypothetical protein
VAFTSKRKGTATLQLPSGELIRVVFLKNVLPYVETYFTIQSEVPAAQSIVFDKNIMKFSGLKISSCIFF